MKIRARSEFCIYKETHTKTQKKTTTYITIRIKSQLVQYQSDLHETKNKIN